MMLQNYPKKRLQATRMSMHIGVNLSAGAKSEIQTKCMEGGRSRGEHNFKSKDKGHFRKIKVQTFCGLHLEAGGPEKKCKLYR